MLLLGKPLWIPLTRCRHLWVVMTTISFVDWYSTGEQVSSAISYDLYRAEVANGDYELIADGTKSRTFADEQSSAGLEYGQVYYYKVRKVKDSKKSIYSPIGGWLSAGEYDRRKLFGGFSWRIRRDGEAQLG